MFEWLYGDPVNGMLMTITFFTFLLIGRQLKLRKIAKKQQTIITTADDHLVEKFNKKDTIAI